MATSPAFAHRLRWVVIILLLPCFCLSVVLIGTRAYESVRAALLFHVASAFICAALLLKQYHDDNREGGTVGLETIGKHPFLVLIIDGILALLFCLALIQAYINVPWQGPQAVLFTYSTFPFVLCFVIHTYLGILSLSELFRRGFSLLNTKSEATCGCRCQCARQSNDQEDLYDGYRDEPDTHGTTPSQASHQRPKKDIVSIV